MPSGVEPYRLKVLNEARPVKVYVDVLRFGDSADQKSPFPPTMAERTEFSKSALTRMLADTVLATTLFEVYDMSKSVTAEQSDLVVDAKIVEASYAWRPAEGRRRQAQVRVNLSLQMKNMFTGQNMFPDSVSVDGVTGLGSGDGTSIGVGDDENNAITQRELLLDFNNAMRRAFRKAALRVGEVVRPMGKVLAVEGCDVALFGGSRFGIRANDELVVFRPVYHAVGDKEVMTTRPVARIRCEGTGTDDARCRIVALAKGHQPMMNDFAVVTDESMRGQRGP